jgi:ABC-type sugar transport system permease subunit
MKVVLFLGGLQNINPQYYQVAQIDGTSRWRVLRKLRCRCCRLRQYMFSSHR